MSIKKLYKLSVKTLTTAACAYGIIGAVQLATNNFTDIAFSSIYAQEANKPEQETRKTPAIRNTVYEKLSKATEALDEKDFATAVEVLDDMLDRHRRGRNELNSYELANVWNSYAFIYYTQEKFDQAISAYSEVVKQPDIPLGMELTTRYTIAQLYFVVENYGKAVRALEEWFKVEANPAPNAYVLLAQGYYQEKELDKALTAVEKALLVSKSKGKEPKEQWYLLMRALYYEKNDDRKMAWTLEELVKRWPKREYFVQLSSMYGQLNNDKKQLAAHDVAKTGWGLEKGSTKLNMAYLYMGNEVPYKGAVILDKGLTDGSIEAKTTTYTTTAQAYSLAQEAEKALPYMEKAAKSSDKGEPWASLAGVYFDNDRYEDSLEAARTAFKKGGIKRPENTYVLMGMALFNLKKLEEAKKEFRKARKIKATKKVSDQWIKYIDSEIRRREALSQV